MRLLSVFGTRPEAVKLAPVLRALAAEPQTESLICVTGQHRALLDSALAFFAIEPDFDLDVMRPAQALTPLFARTLERLDPILAETAPDRVIVHGDTTTAHAAALAAFHRDIPVAHVEAGLRTYVPRAPFPEEVNRRAIDLVADLHFAPTAAARDNVRAERLHGDVFVTGNTGIDALHFALSQPGADCPVVTDKKLILVTGHRRESLGAPFAQIWAALAALAAEGHVEIACPLHPNPKLREPAEAALGGRPGIHLLDPLDYPAFVALMRRADLILTDSGGVQEEAVALGKPVLVMREVTERPEGIGAGAARLVGTDSRRILRQLRSLLADEGSRFAVQRDLYGDGRAAARIVDGLLGRPVEEFAPALEDDALRQIG